MPLKTGIPVLHGGEDVNADELRRLAVLIERTDHDAIDRAAAYLRACADALEKGPVAWAHRDGRVVPEKTMRSAVKDGGAMLSSLLGFTAPLYPLAMPAQAQALRLPEPMLDAAPTPPVQQDDEALEVLRRIVDVWGSPWPPGADPMQDVMRDTSALLEKRGAA